MDWLIPMLVWALLTIVVCAVLVWQTVEIRRAQRQIQAFLDEPEVQPRRAAEPEPPSASEPEPEPEPARAAEPEPPTQQVADPDAPFKPPPGYYIGRPPTQETPEEWELVGWTDTTPTRDTSLRQVISDSRLRTRSGDDYH